MRKPIAALMLSLSAACLMWTCPARAQSLPASAPATSPATAADPPAEGPTSAAAETAPWNKPVPLSAGSDFWLTNAYVFRGINYSKYPGQGETKPTYQMDAWIEYDTGDFGTFGFCTWFDWYGGFNPNIGDEHLFETDYTPYWRYNIKPLFTTVEIGYAFYTYPHFPRQWSYTSELYTKLTFDDSKLFGADAPVLNPFIAYYQDMDLYRGGWLDVGISHKFDFANFKQTRDVPFLKDISVTPSFTMGVDHRYLAPAVGYGSPSTGLGTLLYGLEVNYNVSSALHLPPQYGQITVGGFLKYCEAIRREWIDDTLYGGLKLSYAW